MNGDALQTRFRHPPSGPGRAAVSPPAAAASLLPAHGCEEKALSAAGLEEPERLPSPQMAMVRLRPQVEPESRDILEIFRHVRHFHGLI